MSPAKYQKISQTYSSEQILDKLRLKKLEAEKEFFEKYPKIKKFLDERNIDLGRLKSHSAKVITTGALTGSLLFTNPSVSKDLPVIASIVSSMGQDTRENQTVNSKEMFINSLRNLLPQSPKPLDRSTEKALEQAIKNATGINTRATLEGEHLNTTYGFIGLEQHLMRYPGDRVSYMAPGKGAWGYFAPSGSALTPEDIEREKWYVVVQTLYLPDWEKRLPYLRDWYKYRKVMVVNAVNGNAVVGDIADAGPAAWTGKHFGGSPEVMEALGGKRYTKGAVLIFFVDDPENKVPLGPVEYNDIRNLGLEMVKV